MRITVFDFYGVFFNDSSMDCMARMTRWLAFYTPSLSIVPDDFQDNVNDSNVGVNESIVFLFCMPNDANECPKMLSNVN